jgi:hypothetical protein
MTEPKNRLRGFEIDEVSLVDLAANMRRFLILKRKGEEMADDPKPIEKQQIPAPVKQAALRMLTKTLERMMELANKVKEAPEGEDEDGKMPPEFGKELRDIGQALNAALDDEKYPGAEAKADEGEEDEEDGMAKTLGEVIGRLQSVAACLKGAAPSDDALKELKAIGALLDGGAGNSDPSPTAKGSEGDGTVEKKDQKTDEVVHSEEAQAEIKKRDKAVAKANEEKAKAEEKNAKLEKRMTDMENERELEKIAKSLAADYKHVPTLKAEEFAPVIKALKEKAPDELKKLEAVLKACDEAIEKGGLFAETGPQKPDSETDPYERFKKNAADLIEKSDKPLSMAQAMEKYSQTPEGRKLLEEHRAAQN